MRGVARDTVYLCVENGSLDFKGEKVNLKDDVTLICIDSIDTKRADRALGFCCEKIPFKHFKLLTSLPIEKPWHVSIPYDALNMFMVLNYYSDFCIRHLWKYFETSHCLIVQHDGWIVNPAAWRDEWLEYDYIGCVSEWSEEGVTGKGGNGGFSLRSRRLMELAARIADETHEEDVILSHARPRGRRDDFESAGLKFAPNSVQRLWGYDAQYYRGEFGHHRAQEFGPYPERCRQIV